MASGSHGAHFGTHGARVADGHANHGAAVDSRRADLVGRLKVRVEPPIGIHAGVEDQAEIQRAGQDAVKEGPAERRELLFALFIPEEIGLALGDRNVGVHAAAVYARHRLGQEAGRVAVVIRNLAAEQLVELNLVGGGHHFAVSKVDLELAGRHFGMVLFVLEAHGALHFSRRIDELAQRIERQRMIVAAGIDETRTCRSRGKSSPRPCRQNRKPSISVAAFSVYFFSAYSLSA